MHWLPSVHGAPQPRRVSASIAVTFWASSGPPSSRALVRLDAQAPITAPIATHDVSAVTRQAARLAIFIVVPPRRSIARMRDVCLVVFRVGFSGRGEDR